MIVPYADLPEYFKGVKLVAPYKFRLPCGDIVGARHFNAMHLNREFCLDGKCGMKTKRAAVAFRWIAMKIDGLIDPLFWKGTVVGQRE